MRCSKCGWQAKVMDSRTSGILTVRRYKCRNCGRIFFTKERGVDYEVGKSALQKISKQFYQNNEEDY
jgi:transcriptional regulator NrdR family protein